MYILLIYNLLPKNIQKTAKKEILSKKMRACKLDIPQRLNAMTYLRSSLMNR